MKQLFLAFAFFAGMPVLTAQISEGFSLSIPPDARSGGLGETGAATSTDGASLCWNAAKLPFSNKNMSLGLSYSPLFRSLLPDINLVYVTGYKKLRENEAVGASLRYFTAGNYTSGSTQFRPNEFAIDGAYARKVGNNFSLALTGRYIQSSLGSTAGLETAMAAAADVGAYYNKPITFQEKPATIAFGGSITNIGSKLYGNMLPANLRAGIGASIESSDENMFAVSIDGNLPLTANNRFGLSTDETTLGAGLEYSYEKIAYARGGIFIGSGNPLLESHYTLGAGVRYNVFSLDFAYLIAATHYHSALDNSLRFTLNFDFDAPFKPRTPDTE